MTVTEYAGHFKETPKRPYRSHHFHLVCDEGHKVTLSQPTLKDKMGAMKHNCCPVCQGKVIEQSSLPPDYERVRETTQMRWVV